MSLLKYEIFNYNNKYFFGIISKKIIIFYIKIILKSTSQQILPKPSRDVEPLWVQNYYTLNSGAPTLANERGCLRPQK